MANQTKWQIIAQAIGFGNAEKKVKGLRGSLGTFAGSLATVATAYQAVGFAVDGVKLASKLEGVETAFDNLRKSSGFSANAFNKFDDALDGTVNKLDLMTSANNAMLLGIADSEEQMSEMFDVAQRLARAVGEDATFGIESLVTGLGRQSKLMLDNLGIMIDTNGAYEKYAEELGKSVDNMTDAEKKQGFINEAMKQGKELVENLGEETLTTADKMKQFSVSVDLFKEALGVALIDSGILDGVKSFADAVTGLVDIYSKANAPLKTYDEKLLAVTQTMELLNENVGESDEGFFGLVGQGDSLLANMENLHKVTDSLTQAQKDFLMSIFNLDNELLLEKTLLEDLIVARDDGFLTLSVLGQAERDYTTQAERQNEILSERVRINKMLKTDFSEIKSMTSGVTKIEKVKLDQDGKAFKAQEKIMQQRRDALLLGLEEGKQMDSLKDKALETGKEKIRVYVRTAVAKYMEQIVSMFAWAGPFAPPLIYAAGDQFSKGLEKELGKISFAEGGMVGGYPHSQGGTPIVAERGEYVVRKEAVESIGTETLDAINQGVGAGGSITINNPIISSEFVENELPSLIAEAVRKGADFGMS